jgi:hypothetical protein
MSRIWLVQGPRVEDRLSVTVRTRSDWGSAIGLVKDTNVIAMLGCLPASVENVFIRSFFSVSARCVGCQQLFDDDGNPRPHHRRLNNIRSTLPPGSVVDKLLTRDEKLI